MVMWNLGEGVNKVHNYGPCENGEWLMKIVIQWILITGDIKTNFNKLQHHWLNLSKQLNHLKIARALSS